MAVSQDLDAIHFAAVVDYDKWSHLDDKSALASELSGSDLLWLIDCARTSEWRMQLAIWAECTTSSYPSRASFNRVLMHV